MILPVYIDLHTHQPATSPDVLAVVNKHAAFGETQAGQYYSMGLHPWYLEDADAAFGKLVACVSATDVLAVGECGLDKLCATDWSLQERMFARQIDLANNLNKPLIIHCVRAYPEALRFLRKAGVPVIFHGFNRKQALAQELLDAGHYLSFGNALLQHADQMGPVLQAIPANRLFLETDDRPQSISEVYKAAACLRQTTEEVVILQLQKNFKEVFGL